MNATEFDEKYWGFYLNLESDFMNTQRYITIDEDNYLAFSMEYAKQYQTICSEIDVVCKQYCSLLDNHKVAKNIQGYADVILTNRPAIKSLIVKVNNISIISIKPWKNWDTDPQDPLGRNNTRNVSPTWWRMYNKVKHERTTLDRGGKEFFKNANLTNTLHALAGLFVLEMNFYKDLVLEDGIHDVTIPNRSSSLLTIDDWEKHIHPIANGFVLQDI